MPRTKASRPNSSRPKMASRLGGANVAERTCAVTRSAGVTRAPTRTPGTRRARTPTPPRPNPLRQQVPDDRRRPGHQRERQDDGRVPLARGGDNQLPQPVPTENLLGDDRARDEIGQAEPEQRDERHDRVAEGMAKEHRPRGEAF